DAVLRVAATLRPKRGAHARTWKSAVGWSACGAQALYVETDQNAVLLVHVRDVGLREVIDVCMLSLAPVVAADLAEPNLFELSPERVEVEKIVVNVVEVILAPEDRADHQTERARARVHLAESCEVGHRDAQHSVRFQHPVPFRQNPRHLA